MHQEIIALMKKARESKSNQDAPWWERLDGEDRKKAEAWIEQTCKGLFKNNS